MVILNLDKSNNEIIKLLQKDKSFTVVRLGIGPETFMTYSYHMKKKIDVRYLHPRTGTLYNAGIYFKQNDFKLLEIFLLQYKNAN